MGLEGSQPGTLPPRAPSLILPAAPPAQGAAPRAPRSADSPSRGQSMVRSVLHGLGADSTTIHLSNLRKAFSFCGLHIWDLRHPVTGSEHPNPKALLEILVTVLRSCSTELLLHGEAWPAASGAFLSSSAFLKSVNQGASLKTHLGLGALHVEQALKMHSLCWGDSGSLNKMG